MKKNSIKVVLAFVFVFASFSLRAQNNVTMVNNDTVHIDFCSNPSGIILDDGGADGNYSNYFEGWVIIHAPAGITLTLSGSYNTEGCCDHIYVYNGRGENGQTLANGLSNTGTLNVSSTTGWLSLHFHSDGSVVRSGFALSWAGSGMASTCSNPITSPTVSAIGSTSAHISWSANNNAGPFAVAVDGISYTANTNSIDVTGLNPSTLYSVQIVDMADALSPCCIATTTFRTLCGVVVPPLRETFDACGYGVDVLPPCWSRLDNYDQGDKPHIVNTPTHNSEGALALFCGVNAAAGHFSMAIGPQMSGNISDINARFLLRANATDAQLVIGVCVDTVSLVNNFVPVDTITVSQTGVWQSALVSFSNYTGTGNRIAFRMLRGMQPTNMVEIYVDDFCAEPCGIWHLGHFNRGSNDITLTWDTIGNPTVTVEYGPSGFAPGSGVSILATGSPFRITGLQPSTVYDFRFYTSCGNGVATYSGEVTASTLDDMVLTLNYCQDFELDDILPSGWRRNNVYNNSPNIYNGNSFAGSSSLRLSPYYSSTQPIAVLPMLSPSDDINHLTLSFYAYSEYSYGYIIVGVMDYPEEPSSFVPVDTIHPSSSWSQYYLSLENYQGSGRYIAFKGYDTYTYSTYIDNLQVSNCMVRNLGRTNITSHSVELQWDTADAAFYGDSVAIVYGLNGFAYGEGSRITVPVRGSSVQTVGDRQRLVIDNLLSDSIYQFLVYGLCGDNQNVCDMGRLSAHLLSEDITLPYCVDFEQFDNSGWPDGWSRPVMYSGTPYITNSYRHSGSLSMYLYGNGSLGSSSPVAVLPLIDVADITALQVSFWLYSPYSNAAYIQVGIMDDPADGASFSPVATFTAPDDGWHQYVASLAEYVGNGSYIAFRCYSNYWSYPAYIDDIEVSSCNVKDVTVYGVRSSGVSVCWQPTGSTYGGAVVELGRAGFVRGTGSRDTLPANTLTLSVDTLEAGTSYDIYVSSLCTGQNHTCSTPTYTFTTLDEPFQTAACFDFADNISSWPMGWGRPLTYGSYPMMENGSIRMHSDYGQPSALTLPYLEETDVSALTLQLDCANGYGSTTDIIVGVMDNPTDTSTFVPVDTLSWNGYERATKRVSFAHYAGTGRYVAIMKSSYGYIHIYRLSLSRCYATNVHAYSATSSSVYIGWNMVDSADQVEISYCRTDYPSDSTHTTIVPNSQFTVSGSSAARTSIPNLDPGHTYNYTITPHCNGSARYCTIDNYTFSTMSSPFADGACDDFEAYSNDQLPDFWTYVNPYWSSYYYHTYPMVYYFGNGDSRVYEGNKSLQFYCPGGDSNMISLPYCADSLGSMVLSFYLRRDIAVFNNSMLIVGVLSLPDDASSFVPVDTIFPTSEWNRYSVDFHAYTGSARHIAFKYKTPQEISVYLDNLTLSRCAVSDLVADQVTDRSVRLRWNTPSADSAVYISYIDQTYGGNSVPTVAITGHSSIITGLQSGHNYRFYVWSQCQDTTLLCQAASVSATTLEEPMTVPYCYGFEGTEYGTIPTGWTRPFGGNRPEVWGDYVHSGSNNMRFYSENYGVRSISMIAMPMLDPDSVPSLSDVWVDAWYTSQNSNLGLEIGVMSDPSDSSTFTPVDSVRGDGTKHFKVSLADYTGSGRYVAFRSLVIANNSGYVYLDDVNLRHCVVRSSGARRPMQESIDVLWSGIDSVEIEYYAVNDPNADFIPGTGTMVQASQSPFTVSGLNPATWYTFHVYPVCNGVNEGCNYDVLHKQTLHPSVDVPYCDNFDSYNTNIDDFPNNWYRLSTYDSMWNPQISRDYSHSSPYSCRLYAYDTLYSFLVMPQLHMGSGCAVVDSLYLNFWTRFSDNRENGSFIVGTIQDIYDPHSFVPVDTLSDSLYDWQHHSVAIYNLNTTNTYVAFKLVSNNGSYTRLYLDDLCVEKCVATEVTVGEVHQNSVTITWNSYGVDSMMCEYGPRGYTPGEGTQIMLYTSPTVIDNLVEGTEYDFAFAPMCGCNQYGEAYVPGQGSSGWYYWGAGWGWHWCGPVTARYWCWGWGWWTGRSWWQVPPTHRDFESPAVTVLTQPSDMIVPYCEGFEEGDTLFYPPSWRRVSNVSATTPQISTHNHQQGDRSLEFYATSGHYTYASMPPLPDGDVQNMVLTFSAYSSDSYSTNTNYNHFMVGVMSDPEDPTTFEAIDTVHLAATSHWQPISVDFAGYTGQGKFISFKFAPTMRSYKYYVDDIYVARCALDSLDYSYSDNGDAVTVSWHNIHGSDSIIVEYGPQDFMEYGYMSQSIVLAGSASSVTISPFDSEGSYDIYVTPYCDTTTLVCNPYKLSLNTRVSIPYCEDFEGYPQGAYPDLWESTNQYGNYTIVVDTIASGSNIGDHVAVFRSSTGVSGFSMVRIPALLGNDVLNGKWLNVVMQSDNKDYTQLDFGVLTDTTNLNSFVTITTLRNSANNTMEEFNVQLLNYTGDESRLAIKASSTSGTRTIYLSRIILSDNPYPMAITDDERGYARREIFWQGDSIFDIEYGWDGTFQTVRSDSCHATLTGLQPGRSYEVYFKTMDGERFCQPYRFATTLPQALPACYDFSEYNRYDVPEGWIDVNDGSYYCHNSSDNYPRVWTDGYGHFLDFYRSCMQMMVMPEYDVENMSSIGLSLQARCSNINDYMLVGVVDNPYDMATFVAVDTIRCTTPNANWSARKYVDFGNYSGNGRYIAFMSAIQGSDWFYLTNIEVSPCPLPQVYAVSSNEVRVETVVPMQGSVDYWLEYGLHPLQQESGTYVHIQDSDYTIHNLLTDTTYDFIVHCDSDTWTCMTPIEVTMPEGVALPFCEDFESYWYNDWPQGWNRWGACSTKPYIYNTQGSWCVVLDGYCNQYFVLPYFDVDSIKNISFECDVYCNYYADQQWLVFGVMNDREDIGTFVAVDTVQLTTTGRWMPQSIDFSRYTGDGTYVAVRYYNVRGNYSMYIDNIRVGSYPLPEIALTGATEVTVNENENENENGETVQHSGFWVEYGVDGVDSSSWVYVTQVPFVIGDLQPNTTYSFRHHADSGATTCFPPTVITTLGSVQLPHCENFDDYGNGDHPVGWLCYNDYNDSYPYVYNYSSYSRSGYNSLRFRSSSSNVCYAVLPQTEIDSISRLNLYMSMYTSTSSEYCSLVVGVMDNPYDLASFEAVDTLMNASTDGYYDHHVDFSRYEGNGKFVAMVMRCWGGSWYNIYVDDIKLQSCPQAMFSLSGATEVTVNVNENQNENENENENENQNGGLWVEYGVDGADSSSWIHVSEVPFVISNLEPNTTYRFVSACDSAIVGCNSPVIITTSTTASTPLCEEFSGPINTLPDGWLRYYTTSSAYPYITSQSSNHRLYFYNDNTRFSQVSLPVFDSMNIAELSLTLDMRSSNVDYIALLVGVSTDPYDPTSFVAVDTLRNSLNNEYEQRHLSFADYTGVVGGFITLRSYVSSGSQILYLDNLLVESCDIPLNTRASLYSHNTVRINCGLNGETVQHSGFWVEYDTVGFVQGTGNFVYCDALPVDLVLDNYKVYDFYFRCDTITPTCRPLQRVETTGEPVALPYCESFETTPVNNIPTGWKKITSSSVNNVRVRSGNSPNSGSYHLRMAATTLPNYAVLPEFVVDSINQLAVSFYLRCGTNYGVSVGVMSDPNDASTFLPVKVVRGSGSYMHYIVAFASVLEDARYIAFRSDNPNGSSTGEIWIDDIFVDACGVHDFAVRETESDHITFSWEQVGEPMVSIEYGPTGFARGSGSILVINQNENENQNGLHTVTVGNLNALTDYTFYFDAVCNADSDSFCSLNCHDSVTRFTPAGGTGCIDPTNLVADYTTCFYGSYENPYSAIGVVNYGADNILSRHTVITDTAARDPRTQNLLREVPEGSDASVRLGNWAYGGSSGAEAEAITYSLVVDTNSFDLLILKYAAVLQDPAHDATEQPRFSLELLDSSLNLLDPVCGKADFIANSDLGWNIAPNYVLWKDWTTVGIDMSHYAGQTVYIRLTTRDCGEGSHYGYAYFTLGCMLKNMKSELCGNVDSNRFFAPSGFAYRWYNEDNISDTLSRQQSIKVPTDNKTYYCDCSFVDNDDCMFTLSAFAGTRYPLARFNYTVEQRNCKFYVSFSNSSTVFSIDDSGDTVFTGEACETAYWDFGNGEQLSSINASTVYDNPGTYTVQLLSGIASDSCQDLFQVVLDLHRASTNSSILGDTLLCLGDSMSLVWSSGIPNDSSYTADPVLYAICNYGDTVDSITTIPAFYDASTDSMLVRLAPIASTVFSVVSTDISGCPDTSTLSVTVNPHYDIHDSVNACLNDLPYIWNDTVIATGPDGLPLSSGQYSITRYMSTTAGCDSVSTLLLSLFSADTVVVFDTIVENQLPYHYGDSTFTIDSFALSDDIHISLNNFNLAGCDSLTDYHLHLWHNSLTYLYDTICQNSLPYTWHNHTIDTSQFTIHNSQFTIYDTLFSLHGADSILILYLSVFPVYDLHDTVVICENSLPYTWHDIIIDTSLITIHNSQFTIHDSLHTTVGCDSVATLHLTVDTNTYTSLYQSVVENQLPFVWNGIVFGDSSLVVSSILQLDDTLTLVNAKGCDSVIDMHLTVYGNVFTDVDSTICQNELPLTWNGELFTIADTVRIVVDTLPSGALVSRQYIAHRAILQSAALSDSIVNMRLFINSLSYTIEVDTIIENQLPYVWSSCDSLLCDTLAVYTLDQFSPHGYQVTVRDTVTRTNYLGCDSVIYHTLTVHFNTVTHFDTSICFSSLPLLWHDRIFDTSQFTIHNSQFTIHDTLPLLDIFGADSLIALAVTVHPLYDIRDTLTTCDNMFPYSWRDTTFVTDHFSNTSFDSLLFSDVFVDTATSMFGCDSIMTLYLTVGTTYFTSDSAVICASDLPYAWQDSSYSFPAQLTPFSSLLQVDYSTTLGCDSVATMLLTVNPVFNDTTVAVICENSLPYTWIDTVIATGSTGEPLSAGTYSITRYMSTTVGCDSVATLLLTVNANTYDTVSESVVENSLPHSYHGLSLYSDTVGAQVIFPNYLGCDSVVSYNLTVFWNVVTTLSQSICDDALPYTWNGVVFTEAGTQSALLVAASGADSTVIMTLSVKPTYNYEEQAHICLDALPYTWNDTVIATGSDGQPLSSGNYSITRYMTTSAGCDSVATLLLSISDVYETVDHQESCTPITWIDGNTYSSDTYGPQVTLQSLVGCDSVVILDFRIKAPAQTFLTDSFCANTSYFFGGQERFASGIYVDSLRTWEGCDSIVTLDLTRLEIPSIHIDVEPDCDLRLYGVTVHSDVRYLQWSTDDGRWNNDWGPSTSNQIWVNPPLQTTWTVLCDYYEQTTCPNTATVTLDPLKVPVAQMSITPEYLNYDNDHFYALDESVNAVSRAWWVCDGVGNPGSSWTFVSDERQIVYKPAPDVDTVTVMLISESEYCYDTIFQIVPIYRTTLYAPNAFTPDETSNRYFSIAMDGVIKYELWIYNREGVLVFHSTNPEQAWDGSMDGHKLPQGSYVWILKYTSEEKPRQPETKKGTVLLLR